jgi:DNA-binding NtrC family response regulator
MNFIWLKSCSEDGPDVTQGLQRVIALDSWEDPVAFAAQRRCAAIIVEVKNPEDVCRALRLAGESPGAYPIWIYQPSATAESAMDFMKAGASQVATTAEEIGRAMNSARKVFAGDGGSQEREGRYPPPQIGEGTFNRGGEDAIRLARVPQKTLIGSSAAIEDVTTSIGLIANRRCNVLIEGETGTGKEVVAQEIHRSGSRSRGPWVAVNCGAIPDALLEAELFGHVKGAFTGAVQGRIGKFEAANHGTIFLDEIGDMPFAVQGKLLRVLQEKEVERLGGNERIRLDVRVIAATNVNLQNRVKEGLFRQDLYYRLNVFEIVLPPLREHLDDVSVLANHFIAKICATEKLRPKNLDHSALDQLLEHTWPGNVRELENVIETAVILSGSRPSIFASDIRISAGTLRLSRAEQPAKLPLPFGGLDYQQALESFEHDLLTQALARTRGNKTAAAELLRLKRTTLSARMRVLESRLPRLVA